MNRTRPLKATGDEPLEVVNSGSEDWLDEEPVTGHSRHDDGPDPSSFGGHPYTPTERALGCGTDHDPRFAKGRSRHDELRARAERLSKLLLSWGMTSTNRSDARWFVKRPVEVQAIQYDGTNFAAIREWAGQHVREISEMHAPLVLVIYTLEGVMRAGVGDWIIRGVQGEFYPCKPAIFEQTYEPVSGEARR